jgi:hypothetical protein
MTARATCCRSRVVSIVVRSPSTRRHIVRRCLVCPLSKRARLLALLISLVLSACNSIALAPVATPVPTSAPIPTIAPTPTTVPSAAPTSTPLPSATPTRTPATCQPTSAPGWLTCPGGADTDEDCLPDGSVRLVGYLSMPSDGNQSYLVLNRRDGRPAVQVWPAQQYSTLLDKVIETLRPVQL